MPEFALALAYELGYLDVSKFPKSAFKTQGDFETFCESLADHDLYWVKARYFAFDIIGNEEDCTTYPGIGDALLNYET